MAIVGEDAALATTKRAMLLVEEIGTACEALGIPWICAGTVPRIIHEGAFRDFDNAVVFVLARDLPRLLDYLISCAGADRKVEYFGTNARYPGVSLHYVDISTVVYDCGWHTRYENNCVNVDIVPLRSSRSLTGRRLRMIEQSCIDELVTPELIAAEEAGKPRHWLRIVRLIQKRNRAAGWKRRDKLFRELCVAYAASDQGDTVWGKAFDGRRFKGYQFSRAVISDVEEHTLLGVKVKLPSDLEGYYEALYHRKGDRWSFPRYRSLYTVASTSVSFDAMKAHMGKTDDIEADIRRNQARMKEMRSRISARSSVVDEVWSFAKELYIQDGWEPK